MLMRMIEKLSAVRALQRQNKLNGIGDSDGIDATVRFSLSQCLSHFSHSSHISHISPQFHVSLTFRSNFSHFSQVQRAYDEIKEEGNLTYDNTVAGDQIQLGVSEEGMKRLQVHKRSTICLWFLDLPLTQCGNCL